MATKQQEIQFLENLVTQTAIQNRIDAGEDPAAILAELKAEEEKAIQEAKEAKEAKRLVNRMKRAGSKAKNSIPKLEVKLTSRKEEATEA